MELHPYLFCLSFYLLYFFLPPFEDNGLLSCVPDVFCQHSEVVLWNLLSIQMFFWWICGGESGLPVLFLCHLRTASSVSSRIHLILLKWILLLHPPCSLHIHLAVFPNCFVIFFFHNGILSMTTFINLNHADILLLLSHHFVSWLWSLPFLRWDPFCHHRIKGMVCKKVQGKKELKTKQLTFARPRPARVLSDFGRGSGLGKAGWEKPWTPGGGLGRVSTTSSISLSELLFSERVALSRLTMPHSASNTVKTGESTWEPVSFQISE